MVESPGRTLDDLLIKALSVLDDVRVVRHDVRSSRALLDLEGRYQGYRIIVSEIHYPDGNVKYAYYVLGKGNKVLRGFDNSPDIRAVRLKYGQEYKHHVHERVPHAHLADGRIELTNPMTFDDFVRWLVNHL